MKKLLAILLIILIISSCNTTRRMQNQLGKIHVTHPELLTEYCAVNFPVKESVTIIKGKDSLIYNTVTVDCDSAFRELQKLYPNEPIEVIREKLKTVYVPKIETKYRVDTITKVQENTAKIAHLQHIQDEQKGKIDALNNENEKLKAQKQKMAIWLFGALGLIMLYIFLKVKKILPF